MNVMSLGVRVSRFGTAALAVGAAWRGIATFRELQGDLFQVPVVSSVRPLTLTSSYGDEAIDSIVERNLFRPNRAGATQTSSSPTATSEPAPPPVHPAPLLRGLAGGPPWSIVLENLPGRPGAIVLRQGDTLAGLRLIGVRRDTAVVRAKDTTWKLVLGQP